MAPKKIAYSSVDKERVARVKKILRRVGLGDILPKLRSTPSFYRHFMQQHITYEIGQGSGEIPRHTMRAIEKRFKYYCAQPAFNYGLPGGSAISLSDYLCLAGSIQFASKTLKQGSLIHGEVRTIAEIIAACSNVMIMTVHTFVVRSILQYSNLAGIGLLTMNSISGRSNDGQSLRWREMISLRKPHKRNFSPKGKRRSGYEVLYRPENLDKVSTLTAFYEGEKLSCYITGHCLQRIAERYNICEEWVSREIVFYSADESELLSYHGNLLMPVDSDGNRVGYFVCHRERGTLLLMTFLLVTHNGTPEGDALSEEAKLQFGDIASLALDRLSSFQEGAIDDIAGSLLEKSSLSYMLELNPKTVPQPPYLIYFDQKNIKGEDILLSNTMNN